MMNSENISFTNNATLNPLLITYGNKSVELKILKDTISMYQNSFLEKEKVLKEEKQKLEELNYQVWSVEDSFCEQIWQFSNEHNFSNIFKYYPFVIKSDDCAKQKNNNDKDDVEKSSELTDLINEIDTIRAEIFNLNREKNVKQELESTLMDLQKLQFIADDITELLRLISPLESSCSKLTTISIPIYNNEIISNERKLSVKNKSSLKNNTSNFMPAKKVTFVSSKIYPQLSLERSIVHTTKTTMTNISTEFTCSEKHENFTPKKRSEISIKFEQHRQHIYNY